MVYKNALRGEVILNYAETASGVRGFAGEGYWYHPILRPFGLRFKGATFVAKTVTANSRLGNMPLKYDGMTPASWLPDCIIARPIKGVAVNSVGLSNRGAAFYLQTGRWQRWLVPFVISFMALSDDWIDEFEQFASLLQYYVIRRWASWRSPFVIEINFSCPNTGHDPARFLSQIIRALEILGPLGISIRIKLNVLAPIPIVIEVCRHEACQGVVMGNAIPWGQIPDKIDWVDLFGTDQSPLPKKYGSGGLSGRPLKAPGIEWIGEARDCGLKKSITACGGIFSWRDVRDYYDAGATSIQTGSVSFLRPYAEASIIKYANNYGYRNQERLRRLGWQE